MRKFVFSILFSIAALSLLGRTHETIHNSFEDFSKGELNQISLHSEGFLMSAPALETLADIDAPILWDAVADSKGNLYVGTGNQGVVYKVDKEGEVETLFEPNRLMTRALAIDSKDRLYVSVSPDGTLYRIDSEGRVEVYLKLKDDYVWDMVFGKNDQLYVATGSHGKIYRINTRARTPEAEEFFDSEETHITALAFETDGNLLAGSATHGLLYRIDAEGEGNVIYSTGEREVRTILPQSDGSVYFSSFNQPGRASSVTKSSSSNSSSEESSNSSGASFFADTDKPSSKGSSSNPFFGMVISARDNDSGTVYRMDSEGFVTNWWLENKTSIYSMTQLPGGDLIVGTGSEGKLYQVTEPGNWVLLHTLTSGGEITGFLPGENENEFNLICSNPGRILKLNTADKAVGYFESEVVDFDHVSQFGSFQIYSEPQAGTLAGVEVRGGNLESPDRTWSDWTELAGDNGVFRNPLPPSRFMQYRILFHEDDTPPVHQVRFFSRTPNLAPVITSIKILDSGYEAKTFTAQTTNSSVDLGRSLNTSVEDEFAKLDNQPKQVKLFPKPGMRTAAWRSLDGNEDELTYTAKMSTLGEDTWITLAEDLDENYISFTTQGFADGYYRLKVIVSDDPSNPADETLTGEQVSEVFLIDNTPPLILVEDYKRNGDRVSLKITASDNTSLIRKASYRMNGNDLDSIHPDDGILDEKAETFSLNLDSPKGSGQSLLLEIEDEVGNVTALTKRLD